MTRALHNLEMERALLGAVMHDGALLDRIGFLAPEHFSEGVHARIFGASLELAASGSTVSFLTLVQRIGQDEIFAQLGGAQNYLSQLLAGCPVLVGAVDWARSIHDLAQRRALIATLEQLQAAAHAEPSRQTGELIAAAVETMSAIADDRPGGRTLHSLGEAAGALIDRLNRAFIDGAPPEELITTGARDLNRKLGGWRRRRLYVLGGRPSMGKSATGLSLSLRAALRDHGVLYVSLEMDRDEIAARCIADLAWRIDEPLPYNVIDRGTVEQRQLERAIMAEQKLRALPFEIESRPGLSVPAIQRTARLAARRLAAKGAGLDVIVVDHLHLVEPSDEYRGNKVAQTEEVSRNLKALSKTLDCAVLALVQLSRDVEGRENKRPTLADLRWSGAIEQDADVVMFVYREAYYLEKPSKGAKDEVERLVRLEEVRNRLDLDIGKNRGGAIGTVKLFCDMACNAVRDLEVRP